MTVVAHVRLATREDAAPVALPLRDAALCLDCETVFTLATICPACGSAAWAPIARFLNRRRG
jgi:hypothetical protein